MLHLRTPPYSASDPGVPHLFEGGEVIRTLPDSVEALHALPRSDGVGEALAEPVLFDLDVHTRYAEDRRLERRAVRPAPRHAHPEVLVLGHEGLADVVHHVVRVA